MKTFPLRLDSELHKKLKHLAIEADKPLYDYINDVLLKWVESTKPLTEAANKKTSEENSGS